MDWGYLVAGAAGYLLGSVPTGYVMGRLLRGIDVRDYGSGKTGGTNTLRTLGLRVAVFVTVVDIAKGAVAVLIARAISDEPYVQTVAGLAAVAGHVWPVYVGFRGGRGVGTQLRGAAGDEPSCQPGAAAGGDRSSSPSAATCPSCRWGWRRSGGALPGAGGCRRPSLRLRRVCAGRGGAHRCAAPRQYREAPVGHASARSGRRSGPAARSRPGRP